MREVLHLLFDHAPFVIGECDQAVVIVRYNEPVVIFLGENLSEFGGNTDATLRIDRVVIPAPKHGFIPHNVRIYTTFPHFLPLSD